MRILLDESLPKKLGLELKGHEVLTVQQAGWAGLKNGELLVQAKGQFDVLITGDQNMQYQQNPVLVPIPVVVLTAPNNRVDTLRPLIPALLKALSGLKPGQFIRVGA